MAAPQNLVLQLLITAKDNATAAFSKLFSYLDDNTKVIAGKIREAFAGVFGGGIDGAAELEAQLDRVQAKGNYTAEALDQLQQAAQQLGAQFGISGVEAAQGMESLAAAGLSAQEAIATLPQVLALAKAEQISADAAATKLIDSLSIMGLGFEEAGRMADVLSKGADITTSSASQLAEALTQAGGMARAAGMDLEATVAALDLLHKNGIKGSEAGTALKGILTALLDPASKASTELTALGITSRDLGTVLGELQSRGGAASTAILAFGTEAGPGLRALINEGQQGLNDYTVQLQNAEGAALHAADQMGGNLKSALDTLSSAWDSLRSALLDPLLAPITAQVKDLAGAFQEGLSSDKFKAVQATIKAFGEQAAKAIGDFIRSFDFQGALTALADFAAQAKDHFAALSDAGSKAASVVVIAWNGVTAGMKTIGAAMTEIVASLVATLANIEEAAAKVGLGSVKRAQELRQKALEMQATASGLIDSIRTDADDMGAAFDQLTAKANQAQTALNDLKAAAEIPPDAAVLQPIIRSLEDYQVALEQAKTAQRDAAQAADEAEESWLTVGAAMDYGRATAYAYEEAVRKNKEAQAALKVANEQLTQASSDYTLALNETVRATDAESAAAAASVKTRQALIKEADAGVLAAKRYADATEDAAQAQRAAKDADIALAQAKGDTAEVQRLTLERTELEADLAVRVAQAKYAEQAAEAALAVAKRDQVAALVAKNQATQQDLALAELVVQKELAEAHAAGVNAAAQEVLAQKLRAVNQALQASGETQRQTIEGAERQTEATEKNAEANEKAGKTFQRMEDMATHALRELSGLSAGMNDLISTMLHLDDVGQYFGHNFRDELGKLQLQLRQTNEVIEFNSHLFVVAADGFERNVLAANKARQMYLEQAIAATELAGRLQAMTDSTHLSQTALEDLVHSASQSITGMRLLDDQTLNRLQAAIDAANDKLRQMQEETQSAKDRLAELNAEILEAQGEDQKAAILKQQLDYQQQLAELEKQRSDAELAGNRELLALLDEQERKLKTLNDLKLKNIQAEAESSPPSSPSSSSTSPSASPTASASQPAKTYELKLSGAGKALTAYTDTDPSAFLAAMEDAQRRSLA